MTIAITIAAHLRCSSAYVMVPHQAVHLAPFNRMKISAANHRRHSLFPTTFAVSAKRDPSDESLLSDELSTDRTSLDRGTRESELFERPDSIDFSKSARSDFSNFVSSSISGPVALLLLNFVTILWGSQHAVIKMALESEDGMSPAALNLDRFIVAAILFLPFAPRLTFESAPSYSTEASTNTTSSPSLRAEKAGPAETWRAGFELAAWMFAGYAMQAVCAATPRRHPISASHSFISLCGRTEQRACYHTSTASSLHTRDRPWPALSGAD